MDGLTPPNVVPRTGAVVPVRRTPGREENPAQTDERMGAGARGANLPMPRAARDDAAARQDAAGAAAGQMRTAARPEAAAEIARLNASVRTSTLDPSTALQRINRPMGLGDAVLQLVSQLPEDIELGPKAGLLPYPNRGAAAAPDRILGYQFRSTEGRHIATWIPELANNGATLHAGTDGRGRVLDAHNDGSTATVDIRELIAAARYPVLDPGPKPREFQDGWRQAEADLLRGAQMDDAISWVHPERHEGYLARLEAQRDWDAAERPEELRATPGWGAARNAALEEAAARLAIDPRRRTGGADQPGIAPLVTIVFALALLAWLLLRR